MGVRGTNLFVGVNPSSGESSFFIASGEGVVRTNKGSGKANKSSTLYPSQQLNVYADSEDSNEDDHMDENVNIVDLDSLVNQSDSSIIEAIIKNKQAMDEENEEYIQKLTNQEQDQMNQEDMDRINQNLENLVGNIVKKSIDKKKVDPNKIQDIINQENQKTDKKLNLNNVIPLELSEAEKQKQAKLKELEEQRKKKQEEEKQRQEELKRQNEALLKKLEEQKKKQQEENQKKMEEAKKQAEEWYKQTLSEEQRLKFEEYKNQKEQEKAEQEAKQQESVITEVEPGPEPGTEPSTIPSASASTVSTEVYVDEYSYENGAKITFTMRNESDQAIINLTGSDVEVKFDGDEAYTGLNDLSDSILHGFEHIQDGIYTFTLKSPYIETASLVYMIQSYVKKVSIKVKDILVVEDMYLFFDDYNIPSVEHSSIISFDDIGNNLKAIHLDIRNNYGDAGEQINTITIGEIELKRSNGNILSLYDLYYDEDYQNIVISYTSEELIETLEVYVRGINLGSIVVDTTDYSVIDPSASTATTDIYDSVEVNGAVFTLNIIDSTSEQGVTNITEDDVEIKIGEENYSLLNSLNSGVIENFTNDGSGQYSFDFITNTLEFEFMTVSIRVKGVVIEENLFVDLFTYIVPQLDEYTQSDIEYRFFSVVEVAEKRIETDRTDLYSYTEVTVNNSPPGAVEYTIRGYNVEVDTPDNRYMKQGKNELTYPILAINLPIGIDYTDNYIVVAFYDENDRPIEYYSDSGGYEYTNEAIIAEIPDPVELYIDFYGEMILNIDLTIRNSNNQSIIGVERDEIYFKRSNGDILSMSDINLFPNFSYNSSDHIYTIEFNTPFGETMELFVRGVSFGSYEISPPN